jgi:hypothetical protein
MAGMMRTTIFVILGSAIIVAAALGAGYVFSGG